MRKSTLPILALILSWGGIFLLGLFWGEPWGPAKTASLLVGPGLVAAVFASDWFRRKAAAMVHEHRVSLGR